MIKPSISSAASWSAIFACVAVAAAPALLALTTFSRTPSLTNYLGFAVPILVAETLVLIAALISGMRPVAALLRLSTLSQIAILIWLSALAYVTIAVAPFGVAARWFLMIMLVHGLFALALVDRLSSSWAGLADRLLLAAGWGALTYCILAYGLLWTIRDANQFNWVNLGIGVSNVRQLAFYGLTCAAVGAGLVSRFGTPMQSWASPGNFVLVVVGAGMCIWSGGRAAAGGLILIILFAVSIAPSGRRSRAATILIIALLAGTAISMIWLPNEHYGLPRILNSVQPNQNSVDEFSSGRMAIWIQTIQFWLGRPWFGYGLGQFKFLVPTAQLTYTHPHNAPIQFLFQWGLVGTVAVLVIARRAIFEYARTIRVPGGSAGKIAICLLTGHGAMSMLEGNLFHTYPVSIVILALAVLGSQSREAQALPADDEDGRRRFSLSG